MAILQASKKSGIAFCPTAAAAAAAAAASVLCLLTLSSTPLVEATSSSPRVRDDHHLRYDSAHHHGRELEDSTDVEQVVYGNCGLPTGGGGTLILHGGVFDFEFPRTDPLMTDFLFDYLQDQLGSGVDGFGRLSAQFVYMTQARNDQTPEEDFEEFTQWTSSSTGTFRPERTTLLHADADTPNRTDVGDAAEADTMEFSQPFFDLTTNERTADFVFMSGGRQWRSIDTFKYTQTHEALFDFLDAGGVLLGVSAGSAAASHYMLRGDPDGSDIFIADRPWYRYGLGLLPNVAIDNHVDARNRQNDMYEFLNDNRNVLGLGLYERTAAVVQGPYFQVVGAPDTAVLVYDCSMLEDNVPCNNVTAPFVEVSVGEWYDLCARSTGLDVDDGPSQTSQDGRAVMGLPYEFRHDFKAAADAFRCSGRSCHYRSADVLLGGDDTATGDGEGQFRVTGIVRLDVSDEELVAASDFLVLEYSIDGGPSTVLYDSTSDISVGNIGVINVRVPVPEGASRLQLAIRAQTQVEGDVEYVLENLKVEASSSSTPIQTPVDDNDEEESDNGGSACTWFWAIFC